MLLPISIFFGERVVASNLEKIIIFKRKITFKLNLQIPNLSSYPNALGIRVAQQTHINSSKS